MGVPRLFPWMQAHFASAITHFFQSTQTFEVDNLYLDANPILHHAAQLVYNYGMSKNLLKNRYENLTDEEKMQKVFEVFFAKILYIMGIVVPKKILYIAIDGPAPLAKQSQQRGRRFGAVKNRPPSEFDSNCLTPGTEFMFELTKYINYRIRERMNTSFSGWRELEVFFSPPRSPGEGEHKIMDFIRQFPKKKLDSESHCFYGPDGDLLMLTLDVKTSKMFLFKEDEFTPGYNYMINVGKIRSELPRYIRRSSEDDAINDFTLIGFFVGNDFLPKIRMFLFLEDGLKFMLDTYKKFTDRQEYLTNGGIVSYEILGKFIIHLAASESNFIRNQALYTPKNLTSKEAEKFKNITLLKNIYGDRNSPELDFSSYSKAYYKKANATSSQDIAKMCDDYIRGVMWVFYYYTKGLVSWRDFYPWHYAPLMNDLALFFKEKRGFNMQYRLERPSLPFVQLLSVLPPKSAGLLPLSLREIFTDSKLVDLGYYPDDFEIDYEGVIKEHMAVILLPFVNVEEIEKVYYEYYSKVSSRKSRNILLNGYWRFVFDSSYKSRYKIRLPCGTEKISENKVIKTFVPS